LEGESVGMVDREEATTIIEETIGVVDPHAVYYYVA